jgi:hypothetical protein
MGKYWRGTCGSALFNITEFPGSLRYIAWRVTSRGRVQIELAVEEAKCVASVDTPTKIALWMKA